MVTMKEIDGKRERVALIASRIGKCRERRDSVGCTACIDGREEIAKLEAEIEPMLQQWIAQGCKEAREPCACSTFTDGSSFVLGGFAGGSAPDGAFSFVLCTHTKPDGTTETIHYVKEKETEKPTHDNSLTRYGDSPLHEILSCGHCRCWRGEDGSDVCRLCIGPVTSPEIDKKVIARADHLLKPNEPTPADKLAATARYFVDESVAGQQLREAIDAYRSTRNGIGQTFAAVVGSPPDPVTVSRLMLDTLTGGALASLICMVRDGIGESDRSLHLGPHGLDNLKSNLRALGEKIE